MFLPPKKEKEKKEVKIICGLDKTNLGFLHPSPSSMEGYLLFPCPDI